MSRLRCQRGRPEGFGVSPGRRWVAAPEAFILECAVICRVSWLAVAPGATLAAGAIPWCDTARNHSWSRCGQPAALTGGSRRGAATFDVAYCRHRPYEVRLPIRDLGPGHNPLVSRSASEVRVLDAPPIGSAPWRDPERPIRLATRVVATASHRAARAGGPSMMTMVESATLQDEPS